MTDKGAGMNIFKKSDGAAAVEFAIILPFLLLLVFGVIELGRAIQAKNIITNMSREGANLASRTQMDPQDIMDALASSAMPLDMAANATMYITVVTGSNDETPTPEVIAQYMWDDSTYDHDSRVWNDSDEDNIADLEGVLDLDALETIYAVEVLYRHVPIIGYVITANLNLYSMGIF